MPPTREEVLDALGSVADPALRRSVVELGMVQEVEVSRKNVSLVLAVPARDHPDLDGLAKRAMDAVRAISGKKDVSLDFALMPEEQAEALMASLRGRPPTDATARTRVILVASGKGGVGKSSVTTNLAVALAGRGRSVAVVDADVWGFSIPRMLGVDRPPMVVGGQLVPPDRHGVRVISMGFFAEEDQPVIWRGPMLHKALEQFLNDVWWDEPDYLVVDLPPGTGDISISIAQFLPHGEVFVVTTPQAAAQKVAQRAAYMARKVHLDVRGVIENMSWFTGDDGTRYEIFGRGGGARLAEELDVPLVGQVPLVSELRHGGDTGMPITVTEPQSEAAQAFAAIAERIDVELRPTKVRRPELKVR
jgi:ATP-binding protein involved in chromosome partitioning